MGLTLGPGRFHMPMATKPVCHNYWAHILQLNKAPAQQGRPNTAKNNTLKKKKSISKVSSEPNIGETWCPIHPEEKFLSIFGPVKPGKLCSSKTQWWDRGMIHTSIIRQINHKEKRVTGPKQVQKLEKQIPLNLRANVFGSLLCPPGTIDHIVGGNQNSHYNEEDKPTTFLLHSAHQYWDRLGPRTLCCSACIWTNGPSRIQRNYKGLKITAWHRQ